VVVLFGVSAYRREVSFDIAAGLLPLPIFGIDRIGAFGAMTWAVAVECQFYLLFPVLHGLLQSHGRGFLIRLIVLAVSLRIAAGLLGADVQAVSYWTIAGRLDQSLLGMLAGQYYGENPDRCRRLLACQFPAAIALVFAGLQGFNHLGGWPVHRWWKALWPTAEGLMWTYFILSYIGAARWVPVLVSHAAETVGRISYSVYLLHLVIVQILVTHGWSIAPFRHGPYNAFATTLLIALPATLLVAWLSYTTIEAPFLLLRSRYVVEPKRLQQGPSDQG
jgi:peptidoglycan/LPS O-acetylase OafA/YrhL